MKLKDGVDKGIVETPNGYWRLRNTTYIKTVCEVCGDTCFSVKHLVEKGTPRICSQACNGKRKSVLHTGNTRIDFRGYVVVHKPLHNMADTNGRVLQHRLVMAEHLGRDLLPTEVVHHKDGNRSNNAIENLDLLSGHREHARTHAEESELYKLLQDGLQRCSSCREIKPLDAFYTSKVMRYGVQNQCKDCRALAYKKAHPDTRPHAAVMRDRHQTRWLNSEHYKLFLDGKKVCRYCGETKQLDDFSPYLGNKDGKMSYCKPCRRAKDKVKKP